MVFVFIVIKRRFKMSVILYTTHCPQCQVLEQKLNNKNIKYEIIEDVKVMLDKGMHNAPNLEVDDKIYTFKEAVDWVNNYT